MQNLLHLFGRLRKKQYLCTRKKGNDLLKGIFLMVNIAEWSSW